MSIYRGHIIDFYYYKEYILACFLMCLSKNHGSCFLKIKISSLIPLNFGYYKLKSIRKT